MQATGWAKCFGARTLVVSHVRAISISTTAISSPFGVMMQEPDGSVSRTVELVTTVLGITKRRFGSHR
jgi:hypothetical protein